MMVVGGGKDNNDDNNNNVTCIVLIHNILSSFAIVSADLFEHIQMCRTVTSCRMLNFKNEKVFTLSKWTFQRFPGPHSSNNE